MKHLLCYPSAKVAIVGAGFVGSTAAYALMMNGVASEIALIDINKEKAEGEALDLAHCMQFTTSTHIVAGDDFALVKDAAVIIITAGVAQKPGQTRSELLTVNVPLYKALIPQIVRHNQDCIILVVSNPLDVLTYLTLKMSGFPSCRVFGSGTVLDTARLRYLLGQHFQISPKDIEAYILGEHGDSEFMWLSQASIGGVCLPQIPGYNLDTINSIYEQTRNAADQIIKKKGATYYAIGLVLAKIVRAIVLDQSRVFSISTHITDVYGVSDVCLSLPVVVRKSGTCEQLPVLFDDAEQKKFLTSAQKIKNEIALALSL